MVRQFIEIPVPVDRVDEVYQLLARTPKHYADAGRPAAALDGSVVVRAYRHTSNTMRQFMDLLGENPGVFITGPDMERRLGLTSAQFRGHLGGFTRLLYGPLNQPVGSSWFFDAEPRGQGGTVEYRATDHVAAEIRRAKEDYERSKRR